MKGISVKQYFISCLMLISLPLLAFQTPPNNHEIIGVKAVDIHGRAHTIGIENKQAFPSTLVFIDIGCVISQRMIPYLNELYKKAQQQKVKFYGIISNPKVHWKEAQSFQKEFAIQFPLLYDINGDLAQRMKPTVVPESFVFDIYDHLVYYGRINDQYEAVGKFSKHIRHEDLLNAIQKIGPNKTSTQATKHQEAKGCIFESWDKPIASVTYNKEIEPIIRANCADCHKPKDIGPFPLLSYDDVARRGRMIEFVVKDKLMPIWKAQKGYGKFSNEHSLSDYQIKLIEDWVAQEMPQGKTEDLMPELPRNNSEWKLGEPDLILKMEPYKLPASGDDQYRVFVIKDALPKGKVIKAIDFKAGDPSVVHHSTIFLDYTRKLRQYDAEDAAPGYDAFEKGGTMEFGSAVPICGWAPGVGPYSYPDDVGFYVQKDADLAFENHYHLSGKATTDQSYIGIYYADEIPRKYITGSIMGSQKLAIQANSDDYSKTVWTYVPADIELFDLTPHMHYIGTEVIVDVILPNGKKVPLLHVDDWDLRWQGVYTLRQLMPIPKGSIITATFHYDNSSQNHDNPYYPPKDMYWGWGSNDEMCEVYFSYVPASSKDYGKMVRASFASFNHLHTADERIDVTAENIHKIADQFIKTDIWSKKGQIYLISIIEACLADKMLTILEQRRGSQGNNSNLIINQTELMLANSYFTMDKEKMTTAAEKAAKILFKINLQERDNWNAMFSFGKILLESGLAKEERDGILAMEQLIKQQEKTKTQAKFSRPYFLLGRYYYSKFKDAEAEKILKQGLKFHPNDEDLKQELGSEGRIVKKKLK